MSFRKLPNEREEAYVKNFLTEIAKYPNLYNKKDNEFRCTRKRSVVFTQIANALTKKGFDFTDNEVKNKWKNLKDCYKKHLRTLDSSDSIGQYKNWPWARYMEKFKPFLECSANNITTEMHQDMEGLESEESLESNVSTKQTREEVKTEVVEDEVAENEIEVIEEYEKEENTECEDPRYDPLVTQPRQVMRPIYFSSRSPNRTQAIKRKQNRPAKIKKSASHSGNIQARVISAIQRHDEVDLLLLSFAKTIKKFPPQRQALVKYKMSKLIMEEEMDQLRQNNRNSKTSTESFNDSNLD